MKSFASRIVVRRHVFTFSGSVLKTLKTAMICLAITSSAVALSILPPQIEGKKDSNKGETDNPNVRCILRKFEEDNKVITVDLIVQKGFLKESGPSLITRDKKGLICSLGLKENDESAGHYSFLLRKNLAEHSKITFFADKMYELSLSTLPILPAKRE